MARAGAERVPRLHAHARPPVFREVYNEFIAHQREMGRAPNTVAETEICAQHILPLLGDVRVRDITPLMLQSCVSKMCQATRRDGQPYKASTVRAWFAKIRVALRYAERLGVIDHAPTATVELPPVRAHEATIYEPADLRALLNTLKSEGSYLYYAVSFSARYGLRLGEALGVRWQDLDLDEGILHVCCTLHRTGSPMYVKGPKTSRSESDVALTEDFVEELRELRRVRLAQGRYQKGTPGMPPVTPVEQLNPNEFVCQKPGGGFLNPNGVTTSLQRFQRQHGLLVSTWHDLRHTFGTLLAEAGEDIVVISKALRHSNISITSDLYVAGTTKIKRRASDRFADIVQFGCDNAEHTSSTLLAQSEPDCAKRKTSNPSKTR